MLAYAFQELRQNNYAEIAGEDFDEIYDLFAEILTRGISFQLKQGLHREYIKREEFLNTVKGKININKTISLRTRNSNLVACDYDELSENNIYNIIMNFSLICVPYIFNRKNINNKAGELNKE